MTTPHKNFSISKTEPDTNSPSLLDRVRYVADVISTKKAYKKQALQLLQYIQAQYKAIEENYCSAAGYPGKIFSLSAFSLHIDKIYVTYQKSGKPPKTVPLTLESLKNSLTQRRIPFHEQAAKQYLYDLYNLYNMQIPYDPYDSTRLLRLTPWVMQILQLAQTGSGLAFEYVISVLPYTCLLNGHFILLTSPESSSPVPITDAIFPTLHQKYSLTKGQLRNLLTAFKQEIEGNQDIKAHYNNALNAMNTADVVYYNSQEAYLIGYNKTSHLLSLIDKTCAVYPYTQKALPISVPVCLRTQPNEFLASLFAFTGGNTASIDSLANLIASIAAPTPRKQQLSVLFTRYNQSPIRDFLRQLFSRQPVYKLPLKKNEHFPSISELLKKKNLKYLLHAQVHGNFLILLNDDLPTPSQDAAFRAIIQGGSISVPDTLLSDISFRNQMHLVYVTSNETLATTLVQEYRANLVDLSPWEQPWTGPTISSSEVIWLQRNLLLHGCLCKHRLNSKIASKKADASPPAFVDQELLYFLSHQCCTAPELCCSQEELYAAYVEFYTRLHGVPPTETPIRFGKRVRRDLPGGVEYKTVRHGPEKKTRSCYVGLGIRKQPYTPMPQAGTDSLATFRAYLETMEFSSNQIFPIY